MAVLPLQLAYDSTGTAVANRLVNETHTLGSGGVRVLVPDAGAFFVESLRLYDVEAQRDLDRGVDYQIQDLDQDETIITAKEVATLILITNPLVSPVVSILAYQALGGRKSNVAFAVENLYKTLSEDRRPVDWRTGVLNKDLKYPATWHPHHATTLYGFDSVVYAIERLLGAIHLSNSPYYEALLAYLDARLAHLQLATFTDIDADEPCNKLVTVDVLKYALANTHYPKTFDYALTFKQYHSTSKNHELSMLVELTGIADGTVLFWDTEYTLGYGFTVDKGQAVVVNGTITLPLIISNRNLANVERFRIRLRRRSTIGMVISRSPYYLLSDYAAYKAIPAHELVRVTRTMHPRFARTGRAKMFVRW